MGEGCKQKERWERRKEKGMHVWKEREIKPAFCVWNKQAVIKFNDWNDILLAVREMLCENDGWNACLEKSNNQFVITDCALSRQNELLVLAYCITYSNTRWLRIFLSFFREASLIGDEKKEKRSAGPSSTTPWKVSEDYAAWIVVWK